MCPSTIDNRASVLIAQLERRMWRATQNLRGDLVLRHPRVKKPVGRIDLRTLSVVLFKGFEQYRPGLECLVKRSKASGCP